VQATDVIREAWELYKAHWRHLIPIAAAFYVVIAIVSLLLVLALGWVGALLASIASLIGYFWMAGALTTAVADIRDGRADLSIRETFKRVWPRVWPLLGAGILAGLGIAIGLVLLIVPGLLLLTWWAVIAPAIVLEGKGVFEAFGRSRELIRGYGWPVLGAVLLTILAAILISIAVSLVLFWLPEEIRSFLGDFVSGTLSAPLVALALTIVYFRLRGLKELPVPAAQPPPAP
jgi:hypothetical protein